MAAVTKLSDSRLLAEIGHIGERVDTADKAVDRDKWKLAEHIGVAIDRGMTVEDVAVHWRRSTRTIAKYAKVWDIYAAETKRPKFFVAYDEASMSADQREAANAVAEVVGSNTKAVRSSRREEVAETRRRLADPEVRRAVLQDPEVVKQVARDVVETSAGDAAVAKARMQRDTRRAAEADARRGFEMDETGSKPKAIADLTRGIAIVQALTQAAAQLAVVARQIQAAGGPSDDWRDDALGALDDIDASAASLRAVLSGTSDDVDAELAKLIAGAE